MTFVFNTAENIGLWDLNQYSNIDILSTIKSWIIVMHSNTLFPQYKGFKKKHTPSGYLTTEKQTNQQLKNTNAVLVSSNKT